MLLFNGLLAHLAAAGRLDHSYIASFTPRLRRNAGRRERLDARRNRARRPTCRRATSRRSTSCLRSTPRVVTVYSQGVNQSTAGTDKVNAILNCHLATGRIGTPGMRPVLGDRSAECHGWSRGRRARRTCSPRTWNWRIRIIASSCRISGGRRTSPSDPATRRSSCSRRCAPARSKRSGSWGPIRSTACRRPTACATRSRRAPSSSSPMCCATPIRPRSPMSCCRPRRGARSRGR